MERNHLKPPPSELLLTWTSPTSCSHFLFWLLPFLNSSLPFENGRTANWITSLSPRYKYAGRSGCFALGVKKNKGKHSRKLTAPLLKNGWKTRFSFWNSPFSGGPVYLKGGVRGFLFKNPFNLSMLLRNWRTTLFLVNFSGFSASVSTAFFHLGVCAGISRPRRV